MRPRFKNPPARGGNPKTAPDMRCIQIDDFSELGVHRSIAILLKIGFWDAVFIFVISRGVRLLRLYRLDIAQSLRLFLCLMLRLNCVSENEF